ncbi:uncharacterized protein C20orf141 homolog [Sorex araneus]|uniref:uncharacterized protein C20orf141 homolog n=1 Tax=Sorex araneus TaxID=42254 RepID=UPI00243365E3|nr:uncharacterized protein C20orf141 homolog [Sorex araneus]
MAQLSFFKPQALMHPLPGLLGGPGARQGSGSPGGALCLLPCGPGPSQLLDSVLGLGALSLTTWAILSTAGVALLLLLLLVSFLAFDLFHRPEGPARPLQPLVTGGQSQGAGEGPGQQQTLLLPTLAIPQHIRPQDALLLLLLGLGLLLGAQGMPLALLGLAFCLHPWA